MGGRQELLPGQAAFKARKGSHDNHRITETLKRCGTPHRQPGFITVRALSHVPSFEVGTSPRTKSATSTAEGRTVPIDQNETVLVMTHVRGGWRR